MAEHKSEVAAFRERQRLEEEAAQRGLTGTAVVAQHKIITAKMERDAKIILEKLAELPDDEARREYLQHVRMPLDLP